MQVTLTSVTRTPRVSKKTGKPFTSLSIKTQEHGDKFLSGFAGIENAGWQVGSTVEIEVETKGEYLNFKVPQKKDSGPAAQIPGLAEIKNILMVINLKLDKLLDKKNNLDPEAIDEAIDSSLEDKE